MKNVTPFCFFVFLMVLSPVLCLANSAPVVSGVTATQRADDSKQVDIFYNLADADGDHCTVWVVISDNGGATWTVPAITFSGAVGSNVSPGTGKQVIWDAGKDMPGKVGNYKARVFADDGHGPSDMVLVTAGYFNYHNTTPPIFLPSFFIDKYEVTNSQYCEFLNNADPTGSHYSSGMEITKTGSTYIPISGKENYPVRYVAYGDTTSNDVTAFAQWRSQKYGGNYRLPTAQEWNKAAAWDPVEQHYYLYGFHRDTIDCNWCNYNNCYGLLPVGSFNGTGGKNDAKSYYGCYDMSGNVDEWTNTTVWTSCGMNNYNAWYYWGGSWSGNASACQVNTGGTVCYGVRTSTIGFRLVRDIQ